MTRIAITAAGIRAAILDLRERAAERTDNAEAIDFLMDSMAALAKALEPAPPARKRAKAQKPPSAPVEASATPRRLAMLKEAWMNPALTARDIMHRWNALPGKPVRYPTAMYRYAAQLDLPTQRPLPVEPGASVTDDEKADAFAAFDAGKSVRDVVAEFGLSFAQAVGWHQEWKRARMEKAA